MSGWPLTGYELKIIDPFEWGPPSHRAQLARSASVDIT